MAAGQQIGNAVPILLLFGWMSLRLRKISWRDIGLLRYLRIALALGIGGGLIVETFQLLVIQPLLVRLTGKQPDLSDLRIITGNT